MAFLNVFVPWFYWRCWCNFVSAWLSYSGNASWYLFYLFSVGWTNICFSCVGWWCVSWSWIVYGVFVMVALALCFSAMSLFKTSGLFGVNFLNYLTESIKLTISWWRVSFLNFLAKHCATNCSSNLFLSNISKVSKKYWKNSKFQKIKIS